MSRRLLIGLAAVALALTLAISTVVAAPPLQPRNFVAPLSGAEEVPANESRGRGVAIFQLSPDGTSLSYRLIAANIENVHMAHIHVGATGDNGPVVVWLYPVNGPPPGPADSGRHDGVLATGTITAANLVGQLAGQPLSSLIDVINAGNAYVNVHTLSTTAPSGPGNLPLGEIRGQLP